MRNKILIIIALFAIGLPFIANAQMSKADSAMVDILSGEKERIELGCSALIEAKDNSTFAFINALVAGELYASVDGEAVVKNSDKSFTYFDSAKGVYDGAEKELDEIKIARKTRLAFAPLMMEVNLFSSSAKDRALAYSQIAASKDSTLITIVKECAAKESQPEMVELSKESLNTLYLFSDCDSLEECATTYFLSKNDVNHHQLFKDYLIDDNSENSQIGEIKKWVGFLDRSEENNKIYQNIFSGISLGSILILIALGLSIIYGIAGVINMSHGEFLMIGAYTTYCMQLLFEQFLPAQFFDWAFFLSLPVSFVVSALFGLLIERTVIRHLYSRPLEGLLATLGISLILIQLARTIFGDLTTVKAPAILSGAIEVGTGLMLPYNRLFIIGLTIVMVAAVYLLFQKSRLGVKIRSVTQNRNMSACVGIETKKIDMITFMLGSGLAGVAGCAITLIGNVVPNMGQTYIVDSFLVVVTGGVGKLAGCVTSGLGIGVLSKIFEAGFEAVYGKVLILLVIIIFLQYRPKGLFSDKGRIGDD